MAVQKQKYDFARRNGKNKNYIQEFLYHLPSIFAI